MITLQNEIEGFVVANDKVCRATTVGITSDNEMVVILDNGIDLRVRNVKDGYVFRDKFHAQLALNNSLSDRVLIEQHAARQAAASVAQDNQLDAGRVC